MSENRNMKRCRACGERLPLMLQRCLRCGKIEPVAAAFQWGMMSILTTAVGVVFAMAISH